MPSQDVPPTCVVALNGLPVVQPAPRACHPPHEPPAALAPHARPLFSGVSAPACRRQGPAPQLHPLAPLPGPSAGSPP
eukprot:scaffold33140_cov101-Isochrysis_galbana.AAC.3